MTENIEHYVKKLEGEKDVLQKGKYIKILVKEKDMRIKDIAIKLHISPSYVCHLLRLSKLPEIVNDGYYAKHLSASHLFVLSRLATTEEMIQLYEKILAENLTIQQTEEYVSEKNSSFKHRGKKVNEKTKIAIEHKFKKISDRLEVKIVQTRTRAVLSLVVKGNRACTTDILEKIADNTQLK